MSSNTQKQSLVAKFWQSIKTSTFLWTLLFVAAANYVAGTVHPLGTVPHNLIPALQLSESALSFKFDCLRSASSSPDLMLLGSSLPMCAFYYSEGVLSKPIVDITQRHGLNLIQSYPEANYFRSEIKRRFSKSPTVFNFTTAACMPSDARLLLMRIIGNHRSPSVLVYGLGLRDFVDNINPPPGETPAFRALCDAAYLANNVSLIAKPETRTDLAISSLFQIYRLRDQFRLLAEHSLCSEFNRQTNMERAFSMIAAEREQKRKDALSHVHFTAECSLRASANATILPGNNKSPHPGRPKVAQPELLPPISANAAPYPGGVAKFPAKEQKNQLTSTSTLSPLDYKQRYNPPNYKRLAAEMSELRNIVEICKSNNIKLVLVNMPVSEGNKTLSVQALRERYLENLRTVADKESLLLIDFEDRDIFVEKDFLDTVHLSGYGAKKMISVLLDSLDKEGVVSTFH